MTMIYKTCPGCEDKCGDCANIINEVLVTGEENMNYYQWQCEACEAYFIAEGIHMCNAAGEEIEYMMSCPEDDEYCEDCSELIDDCICDCCEYCGCYIDFCECEVCDECGWVIDECQCGEED
jgi:hypothetical protein